MRRSSPHRSRSSTLLLALMVALGVLLAFAGSALADFATPESGAGSKNADEIDALYKLVLVVATLVFLGVEAALFYSLFKFRARRGAVPAQIRGNTRLEIGWTVGAAVILVVLSVLTFSKLGPIRNPPNSGPDGLRLADGALVAVGPSRRLPPNGKALNVCVNGQQYLWRFTYASDCARAALNSPFSYEEMVVPLNTTVTLDIYAQDVAHSWWIPALGGKFDAVPGYTNHTWFKISKPGVYSGNCAELCGRNHANMTARVRAIAPSDFEAWLAQRKADIKAADTQAQRRREQLQREQGQGAPTQ